MSADNPTSLTRIAREAQDGIGWADYTNADEMSARMLDLARVVVAQAAVIDQLRDRVTALEAQR
ncbi:hypothetical protein [Nocardia asiatica]|uniref:hypothetical protein n=1 Tax=Nocardia asiatica TaxID=209252 RepID=UPI002455F604|nr:hypothetical protein [Nocardia asiatica]